MGNQLLTALVPEVLERLSPHLEVVNLSLGQVISESGTSSSHVYFPIDCIVSLLCVMTDGASTEIGVVGNEGVVGIALFMGGGTTPSRALVQSAEPAQRIPSTHLLA